uniref:WRKY domain-containing protein n=1 Tax=Strongyloides stercoralis TaxID=6248 RepID=A0A0K0ELJ7_STRER
MKEEDCFSDSNNPSSNVERKRIVAPRTSDEEALFLAQKYYNHWPLLEAKLAYNIEDGRNKRLMLLEKIATDLSTKFGVAVRDRRYCEQKLRDMKKEARRSLYAYSQQQRKFSNQFNSNEKYALNSNEGLRKEPNKAIKLIIEALQNKDLFKKSSEGKNTLNSSKRLNDKSIGITAAGDEDIHSDEMEFLEEDTNSNTNYKEKIIPENIQLPLFSQAPPTFEKQIPSNLPNITSINISNRMENHGNSFKILSAPFSMLPVSLFSPPDTNNINKNDTSPVLLENIAANLFQLQNNVVLGNVLGISDDNNQPKNDIDLKIQKDFNYEQVNKIDKGKKERKVRGSNQIWRCVKKFETTDEYEKWLSGEISHWYRNKRIQLTNGYQHLFYCRYSQKAGYQQCRSQMRANYNKKTMQISVEVNDKPHIHELLKDENNPRKGGGNDTNYNKASSIYNSSLPIPIVTTSSSLPSTPNSIQGLLSINLNDVRENTSSLSLVNDNNNNNNNVNCNTTTTTSSISNTSAFTGDGTRSHLSTPSSNNNGSDFTKENQEKKRVLKRKHQSGYRSTLVNRVFITEEIEKNREIKKFYQELNSQLVTVTEAFLNFLSLGCQFFESHLEKKSKLRNE